MNNSNTTNSTNLSNGHDQRLFGYAAMSITAMVFAIGGFAFQRINGRVALLGAVIGGFFSALILVIYLFDVVIPRRRCGKGISFSVILAGLGLLWAIIVLAKHGTIRFWEC